MHEHAQEYLFPRVTANAVRGSRIVLELHSLRDQLRTVNATLLRSPGNSSCTVPTKRNMKEKLRDYVISPLGVSNTYSKNLQDRAGG